MRNPLFGLAIVVSLLAAPARADEPVQLKQVTFEQLEKALQQHKGKVVMVDVWSLGCTTCLKKFPSVLQQYRDLQKDGLVFISITTDEPDDHAKALDFLKKKGADIPNFLIHDSDKQVNKFRDKYPLDPQPMMWLFNRKGEKVAQDEGRWKPDELATRLKSLLAEK